MSRTGLDATTIANSLRVMAGDGSIEWASEPIQASVLLDIADMLDENAKLRGELEMVGTAAYLYGRTDLADENAKLRECVESYGMIANEAVYDYYERMDMLDDANAIARELGIEVGV